MATGVEIVDEPVKDVSDGGLSRFQSVVARQDAAVDNAAQAGNIRQIFRVRPDGDVACAGADDFHEHTRRYAAAHRAEVRVERADRNWNSGRQAGSQDRPLPLLQINS